MKPAEERAVDVHYTGEDAGAASSVADHVMWALRFFKDVLGEGNSDRRASVIIAPRVKGGGYARPGLVVLAGIEDQLKQPVVLFAFISHEFAHLWWTGAPIDTWEDWINESFAECFSLLAVRARFGEDAFDEIVRKRRERVAGLPPVRGIDRSSEDAQSVLYTKGSLLLLDLAARVGEETFVSVMRNFVGVSRKDTRGFLEILARHAGRDVAEEFDKELDR